MKKRIWLAWILALFLVGCGNSAPAETAAPTEAPTEAETEPTVSVSERLEEIRPLYYGTPDAMPDRKAAVAMLEELADEDEPEVNYLLALEAYRKNDYEKALTLCEKAVEQNYDMARVLLGEMYLKSTIANARDVEKAEALFRQAIDNGCADGYVGIGDIHQNGHKGKVDILQAGDQFEIAAKEGTDPYWISYAYASVGTVSFTKYADFKDFLDYDFYTENFDAVIGFYEKAAEMWDCVAMYYLAFHYQNGLDLNYIAAAGIETADNVDSNPEMAQKWAEKLIAFAEQTEDAEACLFAAYLYDFGYGVEEDPGAALEWYQKGAALGEGRCMNQIGVHYYRGDGVEKDPEKEIEWYRKAAEAGNTDGMNNLAASYREGDSLEQDEEKTIEWYERSAAHGSGSAMLWLGYICGEHGDEEQQVEWYEKAAASGYADAMSYLGGYYNYRKDYEKAEEWYIKGANLQQADCMLALSKMYNHYNRVVAKEANLAEMAWKLGDAEAMRYIGYSFERQIFYVSDRNMAITFYKLAADAGSEAAVKDLQRLGVAYNP